jgi:putative DNA primase/helicase
VLCCFSAGNVAKVAWAIKGRCFIVTDNDKPQEQFGGIGTGEYWARTAGKPYVMPPEIKTDLNDMQKLHGVFAVQRLIAEFLRGMSRPK